MSLFVSRSMRVAVGIRPQCAYVPCPVPVAPPQSMPCLSIAVRRLSSLSMSHGTRATGYYQYVPAFKYSLQSGQFQSRLRISVTSFSSKTASNNSAVTSNASATTQKLKWKLLARIVYYLRIPFLVLSVYSIGYQQGIMDYSRDPKKMEASLLERFWQVSDTFPRKTEQAYRSPMRENGEQYLHHSAPIIVGR